MFSFLQLTTFVKLHDSDSPQTKYHDQSDQKTAAFVKSEEGSMKQGIKKKLGPNTYFQYTIDVAFGVRYSHQTKWVL